MATLTTSYQKLGEAYLGNSYGNLYIRIYAKYSEQDIVNNRTKVQYQARAYYSGSTYIMDQQSSGNVNGTSASQVNFSKSTNYPSGETTLGTTEAWVTHDSDGKKSVSGSAYLNFPNWGWRNTATGSADLPTIPRASEISSVSTVDIGSTATILVNRKSTSFTHTITYSFGSLSGTIATQSSSTSINWTIPTTFYAQIPSSKQGSGYLYITTYSGNTQIGSTSSKLFYVNVNESASKPTVSASVVDINSMTINITGDSSIMIAGYSTASVSYSSTPKNSSAIKTIAINNVSAYSGTSYSSVSGTKALSNFNANSINIVATDSRGFSNTKTLNAGVDYTLVNYIPLTFNGNTTRETPTGSVILLTFSGNYYNGTLGATTNSLTITWKYREKGTSSWINGGTLVQGTDYTINTSNNTYSSGSGSYQAAISLGNTFNYQKDYEIIVEYIDAIGSRSAPVDSLKGQPVFNWGENYFNINGDLKLNNRIMTNLIGTGRYDNVNYNDFTETGIYHMGNNNTNGPTNSHYFMLVMANGIDKSLIQFAIKGTGDTIYIRNRIDFLGSGVWGEWRAISLS